MNISTNLLKAHHVGIRNLKEHLSTKSLRKPLIVTDRGVPISINLPYSEVLELLDMIDELTDTETITTVHEGRNAIKTRAKGIPVDPLFTRIRLKHK